jgi:hypothetical protein
MPKYIREIIPGSNRTSHKRGERFSSHMPAGALPINYLELPVNWRFHFQIVRALQVLAAVGNVPISYHTFAETFEKIFPNESPRILSNYKDMLNYINYRTRYTTSEGVCHLEPVSERREHCGYKCTRDGFHVFCISLRETKKEAVVWFDDTYYNIFNSLETVLPPPPPPRRKQQSSRKRLRSNSENETEDDTEEQNQNQPPTQQTEQLSILPTPPSELQSCTNLAVESVIENVDTSASQHSYQDLDEFLRAYDECCDSQYPKCQNVESDDLQEIMDMIFNDDDGTLLV